MIRWKNSSLNTHSQGLLDQDTLSCCHGPVIIILAWDFLEQMVWRDPVTYSTAAKSPQFHGDRQSWVQVPVLPLTAEWPWVGFSDSVSSPIEWGNNTCLTGYMRSGCIDGHRGGSSVSSVFKHLSKYIQLFIERAFVHAGQLFVNSCLSQSVSGKHHKI